MAEEPLSVTQLSELRMVELKENNIPVDSKNTALLQHLTDPMGSQDQQPHSSFSVTGYDRSAVYDATQVPCVNDGTETSPTPGVDQDWGNNRAANGISSSGVPAYGSSDTNADGHTAVGDAVTATIQELAPLVPYATGDAADETIEGADSAAAAPPSSKHTKAEAESGDASAAVPPTERSTAPDTSASSWPLPGAGALTVANSARSSTNIVANAFVPTQAAIQAAVARPPPPSASQDTYAYEEEQERLALLKNLHRPMRKWFDEDGGKMRARYGNFPLFWQDLASWPHMKEVKKLYLIVMERRENPQAEVASNSEPAESALALGAGIPSETSCAGDQAVDSELTPTEAQQEASATSSLDAEAFFDAEDQKMDGSGDSEDGKKKKRKNRWGDATRKTRFADKDDEEEAEIPANKRKSRWSSDTTAPPAPGTGAKGVIPGMPVNLSQEQIQETLVLQMRLQQLNEKLATVVQDALAKSQDPDRSPSPPPRYDGNGVRTNTRDVRMREGLNKERTKVIEEMMKLNPMFRPPADFVKTKPHRKLYIPTDEYPGYNFIGLIIGPRGNTQKRMERETDCKIAIRGKGSVKEGARRGPKAIDEDDELHVYISGETEENVEKAAKEVGMLLRPLDDEQNEHKQKQLRELALINGTLREEDYCNICGEKGHRQFECPKRAQTRSATVEVRCALCGDTSHPTRDCLLHKDKNNGQPGNEASLDKEYLSFMAELGDGDATAVTAATAASVSTGSSSQPSGSASGTGPTSGGTNSTPGAPSSSSSRPAPVTNHYVWEPPKVAATSPAAAPGSASSAPGLIRPVHSGGYQHKSPHQSSNHSSGPPYAQNSQPPPGQPRSPFTRSTTNGSSAPANVSSASGPLLPPPPMAPPVPPALPVPPVPHTGTGMLQPPVPPPQPPLPPLPTSSPSSTLVTSVVGSPQPTPASAPTQGAGKYSHVPPPLPPGGMYNQPPLLPGAYAYPPPPPIPPMAWGAVPPPLPPSSSTGYAPPPLPPGAPTVPPLWGPSYPQQAYVPPPLPGVEGSANHSQGVQVTDTGSHYAAGNPPLPPPPLPGQPPLPPG